MKNVIGVLTLMGNVAFAQTPPTKQVFLDIPDAARSRRSPLPGDVDASTEGLKLFQQHCAQCHGPAGAGGGVAPPLNNPYMKTATQGEIFWVITRGVVSHGMPSWVRIPETQRWQIVAFLASLNASRGSGRGLDPAKVASAPYAAFVPIKPVFVHVPAKDRPKRNPLAGDALARSAGLKLFQQHCAQCHGMAGEGSRKAPPLMNAEMKMATPGAVYWVISNGVVRHGMPSWSKLPEVQRWQIVSFLESLNAPSVDQTPIGLEEKLRM
jgi:mono/diheme cytochrome c family protein